MITTLDDTTPRHRVHNIGWPPYLAILVAAAQGAGVEVKITRVIPSQRQLHYHATDAQEHDIRAAAFPAIKREHDGY